MCVEPTSDHRRQHTYGSPPKTLRAEAPEQPIGHDERDTG